MKIIKQYSYDTNENYNLQFFFGVKGEFTRARENITIYGFWTDTTTFMWSEYES